METRRPTRPLKKEPGDYHHGNLRRALIDAAVGLLEEKDKDAFTLRETARRVGVDHRAAYKHFADKDALLAAIATEGYLALASAVERELSLVGAAPAVTRLLAIARTYVVCAAAAKGRYRLMTGPRLNEHNRFPELEEAISQAFRVVERELARGIERGELQKADLLERTLSLWASMHGTASLVIMRRIRVRKELLGAFAEQSIGCTIRGMTI